MFTPFMKRDPSEIAERISDAHQQITHSTTNTFTRSDITTYAKPGDMIEFNRGKYSHWAIYIGNGKVIHNWGEGDGIMNIGQLVAGQAKANIVESKFSDILGTDTARVNNSLDWKYRPFDQTTIVARARASLGRKGYHFLSNNCEHFATECRYGEKTSIQVENARTFVDVVHHVGTSRSSSDLFAPLILRKQNDES